jgi:hypothetical protein
VDDGAPLEDDGVVGDRQDARRILLDEDRGQPFVAHDARQRGEQLSTMIGARPSSGSSSSSRRGLSTSARADREHLLLSARQLRAEVAATLGEARKHLEHARRRPRAGTRHRR